MCWDCSRWNSPLFSLAMVDCVGRERGDEWKVERDWRKDY